ncbi:MAG: pseudouridine synthase [Candidatus Paceibacterota bacterium]
MSIRINKYLADSGIASRREADELIAAGKIFVNGKKAILGQQVEETDTVEMKSGSAKDRQYLAFYKGRGIITHSPEEGELDIATHIKEHYGVTGVAPVGRLDKDSEGLIILSNDGRITGPLLDPDAAHEKEYEVVVDKRINSPFVKTMAGGVDIEGYMTKPAQVEKITDTKFRIILTEGKKHQIRRMCAALGYQIQSLKRVRIMNIELGALKPNQYRQLKGSELEEFLSLLGVSA